MNAETIIKELKKTQVKINKLKGKKAKNEIYSLIKEFNKGTKIGSRNITTQFLTDSNKGVSQIEVYNGEKGEKIFVFYFSDGLGYA